MSSTVVIAVTTPAVVVVEVSSRGVPGSGSVLSNNDPAELGIKSSGTDVKASRADHDHGMPTATSVGAYTISSYFAELDDATKRAQARQNLGIEIIDCGEF